MAAIDIAGFVADLKDHAVDHGFHVHDERHFVETYSLRQAWEVDLHPEEACGGPLDLHLCLEVDPRTLLSFEDLVISLPEDEDPPDSFHFPLLFTWSLPPLPAGPDLLVLATELAGVGGADLPLEVSAIDSYPSPTDPSERSLTIVAHVEVSLASVFSRPGAALRSPRPVRRRQPPPARPCSRLARRRPLAVRPMCTVLLRFAPDARWPVLLGAIRDEFVDRPWDPPGRHWHGAWSHLLGGRDGTAGGTWLAVDTVGRPPPPLAAERGPPTAPTTACRVPHAARSPSGPRRPAGLPDADLCRATTVPPGAGHVDGRGALVVGR